MRAIFAVWMLSACAVNDEQAEATALAVDEAMEALAPPPVVNGCGDLTVYMRNAADTTALVLDIPGLVAAANGAGQPIRRVIQLPDPRVAGELRIGRRVTSATCTGVIVPPGPAIQRTMTLDGGTLTLLATPVGGPPGMPLAADIDVILEDPTFTGGGLATAYNGTFSWPTVLGGGYFP